MHSLTINRRELLAAITTAVNVLPSKTTIPLLEFALFEVEREFLTVKATDNELSMITTVPCEADGKFVFVVPATRLKQVLSLATDDTVKISVDKTVLHIECGGKSKMPTVDPSEYRAIEPADLSQCWQVPFGQFKTAFSLCSASVDQTATRYALAGVLLDVFNSALCATDSKRLAIFDLSLGSVNGPERPRKVNLTTVITTKFGKCLTSLDGDVIDLVVESSRVVARVGQTELQSPLIQGHFPDWTKVVPSANNATATVLAGHLANLIRRAAVFTAEETIGVKFDFGTESLCLKSTASGKGDGEYSMPISIQGEPVSAELNPAYTLDYLTRLAPETSVEVRLIDGDSPLLFLSEGVRYVQMPLAQLNV